MIPAEHKDELVDAGLYLIRALANVYGSDKAMEFWHTLSDTIDPELKGLTFAAMLTGRIGSLLTINSLGSDKIKIIKGIRTWDRRKLSLREALDMYNNLCENNIPIQLEIEHDKISSVRQEFLTLGCKGVGI